MIRFVISNGAEFFELRMGGGGGEAEKIYFI